MSIEKSVKTLFDLSQVHASTPGRSPSTRRSAVASLALCGTFANILAALMYNLISDLVGGIRFDVVDDGK